MCEYCDQKYNEPFYANDKKLTGLRISSKYSQNNSIIVICGLVKCVVKINYCPMCGRKLGDE